jgi:hypothetical protein
MFFQCTEGLLLDGSFGCCNQLENWSETDFEISSERCFPKSGICTTETNSDPKCGFYGTCHEVDGENYTCICMDNWSGETCSEFDPCNPSPCENDGVCVKIGNIFECECINGYHGKACETDACEPSPCGDGICVLRGLYRLYITDDL